MAGLEVFDRDVAPLPGARRLEERTALSRQFIDSLHRVEYVHRIGEKAIHPSRLDPHTLLFDPLKAAFVHRTRGEIDEAAWLVFLSTHFGKHRWQGWTSTRTVYGALGQLPIWTWDRVSARPDEFEKWFRQNEHMFGDLRFGNHRKYESMRSDTDYNLADVVASYVAWVGPNRGHEVLFEQSAAHTERDPMANFDNLYNSMKVKRFGRTGRFDYLAMLGKLGIADVEPGHLYLTNASGPVSGAKLIFSGDSNARIPLRELSRLSIYLGIFLDVNMQVMEDALCNWQKSPAQYEPFRG
jgi:hypothetical protein